MYLHKLSSSSYNKWDFCQWAWTLTYRMGFEDKAGPSAFLGSIAHKVLENLSNYYKDGKIEYSEEFIVKEWEKVFTEYCYDSPESAENIPMNKIKNVARGVVDIIHSDYTPFTDKTISLEDRFEIPLEEDRFKIDNRYLKITGLIDRVDQLDEESIEIVDYKTGSRKKFMGGSNEKQGATQLSQEIQPMMYYMAASHLYPKFKNILVTFYYLVDGGPVYIPFSFSDHKQIKDKIYQQFIDIRSNEDPNRNIGWHCKKVCHFGKTGICDKVWNEKQNHGLDFTINNHRIMNRNE